MPTEWTKELIHHAFTLGAHGIPDLRYPYNNGKPVPDHWPGCPLNIRDESSTPCPNAAENFDAIAFDTSVFSEQYYLTRSDLTSHEFDYADLARIHSLSIALWLTIDRMEYFERKIERPFPFWSLIPSSFPNTFNIGLPQPMQDGKMSGILPVNFSYEDDELTWITNYLRSPERVPHRPLERNGPLTTVGRMRAISQELRRSIQPTTTACESLLSSMPNIIDLKVILNENTYGLVIGMGLIQLHYSLIHIARQREEMGATNTAPHLDEKLATVLSILREHPNGLDGFDLATKVFGADETKQYKRSATGRLSKLIKLLRDHGYEINARPYRLDKDPY